MLRAAIAVIAAVVLGLLTGCAKAVSDRSGPRVSRSPYAVSFAGLPGITFGDSRAGMTADGQLRAVSTGCAQEIVGAPQLSPVFDGDQLVLLWVYPPYETPEGVRVGSPLDLVRQAYPESTALTPPAGSYVFPGLLVTSGNRAYLFLHDGHTVQKTIIGFVEYAKRLYEQGFGTC